MMAISDAIQLMQSNDLFHAPTANFKISPLVSGSLTGLMLVLVAPLPLLMVQQHQQQFLPLAFVGLLTGGLLLGGLLSQRVVVDTVGIRVEYATWVPGWLAQGWTVTWPDIQRLHSRPTSQGGQAHYVVTQAGQAYLLPMRIAGFAQFLRLVESYSQLDTSQIKPLAQPWMYLMLAVCVILMGLIDLPIMMMASTMPSS